MTTETRSAADLIAGLEAARKQFLDALEGIPENGLTKTVSGDWSVKDILAHVASWDELCATDAERASRGHIPALLAFKDEEIDDWNDALMRGRTGFSVPQVWFELEDRRNRLVDALKSAPDAFISGPLAGRMCDILNEHDEIHAKELNEWRQSAGI